MFAGEVVIATFRLPAEPVTPTPKETDVPHGFQVGVAHEHGPVVVAVQVAFAAAHPEHPELVVTPEIVNV